MRLFPDQAGTPSHGNYLRIDAKKLARKAHSQNQTRNTPQIPHEVVGPILLGAVHTSFTVLMA